MITLEQLTEIYVEAADTLVDDFDVVDFLSNLTRHAATVGRADAAGLLLADAHGQLKYMASSDESVKLLELFQLQYDEGPCLDCFRTGGAVVNTDLPAATVRWPLFALRAAEAGYRSVHAFPLRHRGSVIGALNLFSGALGRLEPDDIRVVQSLADIATIGLLQERAIRSGELLAEQLQGALNSRVAIEQAKGALARIHGVGVDAAFDLLRAYSRSNHLRLNDVAVAVLARPEEHPRLTTAP